MKSLGSKLRSIKEENKAKIEKENNRTENTAEEEEAFVSWIEANKDRIIDSIANGDEYTSADKAVICDYEFVGWFIRNHEDKENLPLSPFNSKNKLNKHWLDFERWCKDNDLKFRICPAGPGTMRYNIFFYPIDIEEECAISDDYVVGDSSRNYTIEFCIFLAILFAIWLFFV